MTQLVEARTVDTKTCDRSAASGAVCGEVATQAYNWEWGESGVCCDKHAFLLQQVAGQIERKLTLTALTSLPVPVGRDERIKYTAEILVLKEEIETVKIRGLELYRINERLAAELKLAQVRAEESRAQMIDAQKRAQQLDNELVERDAEHARLLADNERLRLFESLQPSPQ